MRVRFGLVAAAALAVAGCSKSGPPKEVDLKSPAGGPVANNSLGPKAGDPAPGKEPGKAPAIPTVPEPSPEAFKIPESTPAPAATEGKWVAVDESPSVLAERISKAFREMKDTFGESRYTIKTPTENGQVKNAIKVQDYKTYSIQTLQMSAMPNIVELRADGSKKSRTSENGSFASPKPLGSPGADAVLSPKQLVERWPREFPRLAFAGLTEGKEVWKPFFQELFSGRSGFKGEISRRTMEFRGKKVTNYRVVAKRTPEAAKKLGRCEMEMVFDGQRYLPVTIRVNLVERNGGAWNILWQTGWNFGQKFEPKDFALPN